MTEYDFTESLVKLFVALPAVILIAYFSLRLANKYMKGIGNSKNLEVIETVQIYSKAALSIVRVMDTYYVFGVSENGVDTIRKLNADEAKLLGNAAYSREEDLIGRLKGIGHKRKETGGNE